MEIGDLFVLCYEISEEDHGIIEIFSSEELAFAAQQIISLSGKYPKLYVDHYRLNDFVGMINNHMDCFKWYGR